MKSLILISFLLCTACYNHKPSPEPRQDLIYGAEVEFNDPFYGLCSGSISQRRTNPYTEDEWAWEYAVKASCSTGQKDLFWVADKNLRLVRK